MIKARNLSIFRNLTVFSTSVALLLFIAWLPVVWMMASTGFALVDDYTSMKVLEILYLEDHGIKKWLVRTFADFSGADGRFRPFLDIYNLFSFKVFGGNASVHHMARLAMKLLTAFFGVKILGLFARSSRSHLQSVFIFLSIFLFFPNAPESRLAPVETPLMLFLACHMYLLLRAILDAPQRSPSNIHWLGLILSYLLLSWSKETAVFLMVPTLCVFFFVMPFRRAALATLPFAVIFLFLALKVRVLQQKGGYGTSSLTMEQIIGNLKILPDQILLWDVSPYITLYLFSALAAAILGYFVLSQRLSPRKWFVDSLPPRALAYTYTIGVSLLFVGSLLILWAPILRYYSPSNIFLGLFAGLAIQGIQDAKDADTHRWYKYVKVAFNVNSIAIFCVFFAAVNLYNLYFQYEIQRSLRAQEQNLIRSVHKLFDKNVAVRAILQDERDYHLVMHFLYFLPVYKQEKSPWGSAFDIERTPLEADYKDIDYVVSWSPMAPRGFLLSKVFDNEKVSFMQSVEPISAFLQHQATPLIRADGGVGNPPINLMKNQLRITGLPKQETYAKEGKIYVAGTEQHLIKIDKPLNRNSVAIVDMLISCDEQPVAQLILMPKSGEPFYPIHHALPPCGVPVSYSVVIDRDMGPVQAVVRNQSNKGFLLEELEVRQMAMAESSREDQ